ncbi:MAG TPA: M3 family metallopeptidase [Steroidobacteraceae bacterium]|jgi:oligoendopeptidase F
MKSGPRIALHVLGLIAVAPPAAYAQATSYAIDQTRYFATPAIESTALEPLLKEASAFPAKIAGDPAAIEPYLRRAEDLLGQLERHQAYLHLRASRDIDDQADADADDKAGDAMDSVINSVGAALRTLDGAAFAQAAAVHPDLKRYAYVMARAQRNLPHELPKEQEAIIHELADSAAASSWTLYQQTVRSTPFAKIHASAGELDVRKDAGLLLLNADRTVRQAAWQQRWDGFTSRADVYAGILVGLVRLNDRVAKLRHFPDAPSMVYFSRDLDRAGVDEALAAVEGHAGLLKDYQRLKARHVGAFAGMADVHSWDLSLPMAGFAIPQMTLEQTRAAVLLALAPLGADYVQHFRQLLDPVNARMDIASEQGKRTNGGFSIGAPGVDSGLFVENYGRGFLGNSRVVAHEGGHAIHRQLMNENGVSRFYTRGPNWMFEAFAIFNEFLLYDHLYHAGSDPKARAYYLDALVDDINKQLFTSAEEGTLEQSIYDGVMAGKIKNAADLDALSLSIWGKYEIWPATEPQYAHIWVTKSLLFEDPLYLVNYLYAGLLATKMFDMVTHDPAEFQKRYADLLRKGFYAPPKELLRVFFGRDLSQQQLVDDGMAILKRQLDTLAEAYRTVDAQR